ncbi:hypothetical protein [Paenibacillus kandeliae]|uniref:hypothetical protein n=1 Tax=Paenibacillus kandeliae TaxID=3231269 RepID=UPI003459FAFC
MAVGIRKRPILQGKDAERFLERSQKNEEFMRQHAAKKAKEYHEKLANPKQ